MKLSLATLALAASVAFVLGGHPAAAADAPPVLSIRKALDLAEKALSDKNAQNEVYIASVGLTRTSMLQAPSAWEALWSSPIAGSKPGTKEVGVQITMNGDVIHLLKGKGSPSTPAKPR